MERKTNERLYYRYIKRFFDVICSALVLTVFCWLYGIIALLVRIKLGSPVIFKQQRPGKDEKLFFLYKFRTMTNECDEFGELLPDNVRLTRFGKALRATSFDEIPEIWNIFIGDMSIVGPRPLLVRYLPYYSDTEKHRHDARPGLTGLAQINGRNFSSWEERFALDLSYLNNITFLKDLSILLNTIVLVFRRGDVADRGKIYSKEDGNLYIDIDGKEIKYPQPLDIERIVEIKDSMEVNA